MVEKIKNLYRKYFWSDERYARFIGVKIGKNCRIATRFFGSEPYLIEIGNHVQITQHVRFSNHGGGWVLREKYPDFDFFGKIKVGNNVYIGNSSIILAGVTIGDNVIVGAGSVVTKSIPSGSIVGGNPAKIITTIENFENTYIKYNVKTKKLNAQEKKEVLMKLSEDMFINK
ncbi:acyltransferase [Chryseobacterium profundimaris]|uniref:Transferase hexapeptide (Six repeat-containing protein) n=1 Tax=Chryseobacterium profundimaris TaxID=1387275 RepID=A0ABY1NR37_9FLAO|nr:acyltransferase [Chryseobacterium profundimaris]SMP15470.1 transferase hexapeptide (six repeat-containing protein) [Chryseobacterium profundimaris]